MILRLKRLLLIVMMMVITFCCGSKGVKAYYQFTKNSNINFTTAGYNALTLSTDKSVYGLCGTSASMIFAISNPNDYAVTYTIEFSNNALTYTIDGASGASYTVNAKGSKTHTIIASGTTTTSLTITVSPTGPYKSSHTKSVTFDVSCPTTSITSTNNVAASQTATISCSDTEGMSSYYWGTSSSPAASEFTTITSNLSTTQTVSAAGTYNLICKDENGNTSTTSKTYYKTTLTMTNGTVSPTSVITMSGNGFVLPTPTAKTGYTNKGAWYTSDSYSTSKGNYGATYTPTTSATLYSAATANTYTIGYTLNGGTAGANAPTSGTYDSDVQISNPTRSGYEFAGWTSTTVGSNGKIGTAASPSTAWSGASTKNTYFRNLRESGTVTLVANWKYTATFYYWDKTNSKIASTTATCTGTTSCSVTIPTAVTGSTGEYGNAYAGLATSLNTATVSVTKGTTTLTLSANTTYYGIYSSNVTVYYPKSTTEADNETWYRNSYFKSTSAMNNVLSKQTNGTVNATNLTNMTGVLKGFATALNTSTTITIAAAATSTSTTFYAVSTNTITATFYYQSSTEEGTCAVTSATADGKRTNYCTSTTTATSVAGNITVPTVVSESVGKYNAAYLGVATAVKTMSTTTPKTSTTTYYAVYRTNVTNYYYSSSYTSRTIYRNEWLTSKTACGTPVLSTSTTGTTNYSTAVGPGSSVWTGLATSATTTVKYESVSEAAQSTATELYTIYTFNVTYAKGANVSAIGKTSDSCKVTSSNTSCNVTLPSITANTGYTSVGWGTNGATTGTAAGASKAISSNSTTLYANAKVNTYTVEYYTYNGGTKLGSSSHTYGSAKALTKMSTLGGSAPNTSVTFYGWATSANGTSRSYTDGQSVTSLTSTANGTVKLYAIYRSAGVVITYKSGLNSATSKTSTTYYYYNAATSVSIKTETPAAITSWSALGWRDDTTASSKEYSSATATNFSASKTLYGVYSRSYTATFYSGVSKATTKTKASNTAYYNSNAAATPTTVSITLDTAANSADISNWTELGWRNDTTAGAKEYSYGASATVSFGTNFYSVYSRTLTVSYNANGGSGTTSATTKTVYLNTNSTTTSSQAVTLAANAFTRTGYTFSKWAAGSASGTQYAASASYTPGVAYNASTFGKTMYAIWTANTYTVYVDGNGVTIPSTSGWTNITAGSGKALASKSVTYASTYGTLPTPTRSGYTFNGWSNILASTNLTIAASTTNNYNYKTIFTEVVPGATYTITMSSATRTAGSATQFRTLIYDFTSKQTLAYATTNFGSNISYTITAPSTAVATNNLQLIVYAGINGSTANNAVTYSNIKVSTTGSTTASTYTSSSTVNTPSNHEFIATWVDNIKPTCSFGSWSVSSINVDETATIVVTCKDAGSGVSTTSLTSANFTISDTAALSINSITTANVTGGKSYTITVTALNKTASPTLTLKASVVADVAGNKNVSVASSKINTVADTSGPEISFNANGNSTAAKSQSSAVTVTDHSTMSAIKYLWTQTSGASASSGTSFSTYKVKERTETKTKSDGDGTWYLCVYAADSRGNSTNKCSKAFKLDNTKPTITLPANPLYVLKGSTTALTTYASFSDSGSGIKTKSANYTNASSLALGSYTLTYTATDNAGNTNTASVTMVAYSNINCDLSGMSKDPTDNNRCIFRGANPNNYIKFNATYSGLTASGGTLYRIIGTESNKSIKIIHSGSLTSKAFHSSASTVWASSDLRSYLNGTASGNYYATFNTYAKNHIQPTKFNIGTMNYYKTNAVNKTIADTATAEKSAQESATSYVGLMSVYDFLLASSNCTSTTTWSTIGTKTDGKFPCDVNNWLVYPTTGAAETWFITPYNSTRLRRWLALGCTSSTCGSSNEGSIQFASPIEVKQIRPAIYLKESVIIIDGTGTSSDPYILAPNKFISGTSSVTCSIGTTSGYVTSQTLTITPSSTSGVTYSWDGVNYSSTKTKTVTAAGTYTAYIKDSSGKTNTCSVTIKSRMEYKTRSCTGTKTHGTWSSGSTTYNSTSCSEYTKDTKRVVCAESYKAKWSYSGDSGESSILSTLANCQGWCNGKQSAIGDTITCTCYPSKKTQTRTCTCGTWGAWDSQWSTTAVEEEECSKEVQTRTTYGK